MADIGKELNDIKNAVYGKEVRGSIHDGIKKINEESEESKKKADEAHEITQDLLDETFDSAALEANFEQRLDIEIANLQPEWTQFKDDTVAQLAQIGTKLNFVTPEMFGAIGDGLVDDTNALKDADQYAFDNKLPLIGHKRYKITSTWTIKSLNVELLGGGVILADNFRDDVGILMTGNPPEPINYNIIAYGNKVNQTHNITLIKAFDLSSSGGEINVFIIDAYEGFVACGNTERLKISVDGRNTTRLVVDREEGTGDVTPDELTYYISSGLGCEQFYAKESASISYVHFNTEGSGVDTSEVDRLISIDKGDKPTILSGIIRTPRKKTLRVDNQGAVHFNGLQIYGPDALPIELYSCSKADGDVTIISSKGGGALLRSIGNSSKLSISVKGVSGGDAVVIGEGSTAVNNSLIEVLVSAMNDDNNILNVQNANQSEIKLMYTGHKPPTKGIVLANNNFSLKLGHSIFSLGIPIIYTSGLVHDIEIIGRNVSLTALTNYPFPVAGMRAYSRDSSRPVLCLGTSGWVIAQYNPI